MPKEFDSTLNSDYMECPYCGNKYAVEGQDYSQDERVEECDICEMKYHAVQSYSVDYEATPDCKLNGLDHIWEPLKLPSGTHDFCTVCNKYRGRDHA